MYIRPLVFAVFSATLLGGCTQNATGGHNGLIYNPLNRGQVIYAKECAHCHGTSDTSASQTRTDDAGSGSAVPDLTGLSRRNGGTFPRDFVRRFVLGLTDANTTGAMMPAFAKVGLRHVYPEGGADGEVLEADFADLLDYLEAFQK
jgi:mono/diheme cytochrome c family protein